MQKGDVLFGLEAFKTLDKYLEENSFSNIFILTDSNTLNCCLGPFLERLENLRQYEVLEVDPGEEHKNIDTVLSLWNGLTELGANRNSLIINLGGGVITDMGGFVASTFKRGIKFINVPTTILAMVDASTGGKTGIDLGYLKNQIGVFNLPEMVLVTSEFLATLDARQMRSGLAEMFKHGLIANKKHWETLKNMENFDISQLDMLLQESVSIKQDVVDEDPEEKGLRKILNFGHTIGHAVETYLMESDKMLFHGEAVAVGMICEAYLSNMKNSLSKEELEEIKNVLLEYFPKAELEEKDFDGLIKIMLHDKKNTGKSINFSLLDEIGKCKFDQTASDEEIKESLRFYLS